MTPTSERVLDVSELEAPQPLFLVLAAIETLTAGTYLRMHHRMQPCLLYDELQRRGYESDTRQSADGLCDVYIWRRGDKPAGQAAQRAAAAFLPWIES